MKLLPLLALLGIGAAHPHQQHPHDAAAAAAVLGSRQQACSGPVESNPSTWWRAAIGHNGTAPTSTDSTYQYYRTAVQYGADNTGVQDSSDAFNSAIEGMYTYLPYPHTSIYIHSKSSEEKGVLEPYN